jgi:hypothetical protein
MQAYDGRAAEGVHPGVPLFFPAILTAAPSNARHVP